MATAGATAARCSISKCILSGLAAGLAGGIAPAAHAHGFGQRFDLFLPLWLWLAGAGATIVVTFVLVAAGAGKQVQPGAGIPLPSAGPRVAGLLRAVVAALFLLSLAAGFFGNQDPYRNLLPTVVWVLWWVGLAFVCALVGNLWALINPLDTLFRPLERWSLRHPYPGWLAEWPAVLLFVAFAWAELVWPDKDVPARLACAVFAYAFVTWGGMFVFGREAWLRRGEAFSVAFGILARFAPIGRDLRLRLPGAGLLAREPVSPGLMAFVLLMLATVTYDGFLETPLFQEITAAAHASPAVSNALFRLSEQGFPESVVIDTVLLAVFPTAFAAIYLLTSVLMARGSGVTAGQAARGFVLTLVPIAVAYHLSHYFTLLLTAGQFIIPLASDPFGYGWDLFGTVGYKVDLTVVSPYVFWYGAVALIVLGHVVAVLLAHAAALGMFPGRAAASQVPMMALMVGYTVLSLWIMAQPVVS